jgi:DNA-binding response OmpR family regulator
MRILVAEDDAPLAEFLHQWLQQEQFSVHMVSDGREAQRLASDLPYDFVILDLNLPAEGGLDVLRHIRAKKPDLPVLMVTGTSHAEDHVRLLDAGADDSLAKPFDFAELAARIRAVLRRGSRPGSAALKVGDLEIGILRNCAFPVLLHKGCAGNSPAEMSLQLACLS